MPQSNIFYSINPFTSAVIQGHPAISVAQLEVKIASAHKAFQLLKNMPAKKRGERIEILGYQLAEKKEALARIITSEMGKVYKESLAEIEKCILCCQYYAAHADEMDAPTCIKTNAQESYVVHQPIGAVFGIMPWNFPFWQVIRFVIPAMAAGNVVLLKHAPNVFGCAEALEEILNHCGFPENVFQSLVIDTDLVENVIASDIVQGVTFTGSETTGSKVAALAGKHIKKSVLELGGSDPFIVLEDADLHQAVTIAVLARLQNAGQSCIAAKRFMVVEEVYDAF
ncbi:MAG: aldehyde dehydrogenase family protein, partial [Chitinophagales bacterium]